MSGWTKFLFAISAVCLANQFLNQAIGQDAIPPRVTAYRGIAPNRNYYGVMGQVQRPGIYQYSAARLSLTGLIQQAGGLTGSASRNVRIIRNGRSGQRIYFTPSTDHPLVPGDLVVVDEERSVQRGGPASGRLHGNVRSFAGSAAAESNSSPAGGHPKVQVALINVLPRPVLMNVEPHDATVDGIVQLLHQDQNSVPSIRVVQAGSPQALPVEGESEFRPAPRLVTGAVLIFPIGEIDPARLPRLPEPILTAAAESTVESPPEPTKMTPDSSGSRSTATIEANSSELATALSKSAEPIPVKDVVLPQQERPEELAAPQATVPPPDVVAELPLAVPPSETLAAPSASMSPAPISTVEPPERKPFEGSLALAELNVTATGSAAVPPENTPSVRATNRLHQTPPPVRPNLPEFVPPAESVEIRAASQPASRVAAVPTADKTSGTVKARSLQAKLRGSQPLTSMLVLAGTLLLVACCGTFILIRQRVAPAVIAAPPRPLEKTLELLIQNRIPLTEERFQLPHLLELHGRPAGGWRYRHDPAHVAANFMAEIPEPHVPLRSTAQPAAASSARAQSAPMPSQATSDRAATVPANLSRELRRDSAEVVRPDKSLMSSVKDVTAGKRSPREGIAASVNGSLLDRVLFSVQGGS